VLRRQCTGRPSATSQYSYESEVERVDNVLGFSLELDISLATSL
jgi:hypothetical protein